jgi:hypothetical protein
MAAASPPLDPPGVRSTSMRVVRATGKVVVGLVAQKQLGSVRLADDDGSCGAQTSYRRSVCRGGRRGAEAAAASRGQTRDVEAVLHRHGNARERSRAIGAARLVNRLLADRDERIDARVDAPEMLFYDFDRGDRAAAHHHGDFRQGLHALV